MKNPTSDGEWAVVEEFYGQRTAARSKVPLIEHIKEGISILESIGGSADAKRAFCLHPLFQNDNDLLSVGADFAKKTGNAYPVVLAMEYRARANSFLSDKILNSRGIVYATELPDPGSMIEVKHMLMADKIQNRKDFERFHKDTHERSAELDYYFKVWFKRLEISEETYQSIVSELNA